MALPETYLSDAARRFIRAHSRLVNQRRDAPQEQLDAIDAEYDAAKLAFEQEELENGHVGRE